MPKTIKVTVELVYDQDELGIANFGNEYMSDEDWLEYVKDNASEDIWELVRGSDVEHWATIEVVE